MGLEDDWKKKVVKEEANVTHVNFGQKIEKQEDPKTVARDSTEFLKIPKFDSYPPMALDELLTYSNALVEIGPPAPETYALLSETDINAILKQTPTPELSQALVASKLEGWDNYMGLPMYFLAKEFIERQRAD
jgi:hypothetical protein